MGPGYDDTRIRPWNAHNTKLREAGRYYDRMWEAAVQADADVVSITSFNEWGEGTQVEPARAHVDPASGEASVDYADAGGERAYLERTARWAERLVAHGEAAAAESGGTHTEL